MLDDFYFEKEVITSQVEDLLSRIDKINNFACLYLSDLLTSTPCYYDKKSSLYKIHPFATFKVNASCAIWNKDFLMKILRPKESPWNFEHNASKRTCFTRKRFYSQYNETYKDLILGNDKERIKFFHVNFEYQIFQGKWTISCVKFLQNNGIKFDFSSRGVIEYEKFYGQEGIKARTEYLKKMHYKNSFLFGFLFIVKNTFRKIFRKKT